MTQTIPIDGTSHVGQARATKAAADEGEEDLTFSPPLYSQRAQLVQRVMQQHACRRLVDAGCSYGDLLLFVMHASSLSHLQLTHVTAIDLDPVALAATANALPVSSAFSLAAYTEDCVVQCLHGDLASAAAVPAAWLPYPSDATQGATTVDAVISIEVVEHIPPHLVAAYTHTVFAELGAARGARVVVLTTPNRDENYRLPPERASDGVAHKPCACGSSEVNSIYRPDDGAPRRRHDEHFFELTRVQWRRYVEHIEACYGAYWRAAESVLLGGGFTQGTIFVASEEGRKGITGASTSSVAAVASRDAALTAFPFKDIYGMAWSDYAARFLPQHTASVKCTATSAPAEPTATTAGAEAAAVAVLPGLSSCGGDCPYTRVEHRVIHGVPLWERLRDVVRRSTKTLHLPRACALPSSSAPTQPQPCLSMLFEDFFTRCLAPRLHTFLEDCTLPLLLAALMEQRALWVAAVWKDADAWRQWFRRARQHGWLRACGLHERDAHARVVDTRLDGCPLVQSAAAPMTLAGEKGEPRVPLFPLPSVASAALKTAVHTGVVGGSGEGLQLLQRGRVDTVGLLLITWLTVQVEACASAAAGADACDGAPQSSVEVRTMKLLQPSSLRLLLFLVGVDVLPDAYAALGVGGVMRERHVVALYRDVSAATSSPSPGAGGAVGRRRGRRCSSAGASEADAHEPYWLRALLKTAVSLS